MLRFVFASAAASASDEWYLNAKTNFLESNAFRLRRLSRCLCTFEYANVVLMTSDFAAKGTDHTGIKTSITAVANKRHALSGTSNSSVRCARQRGEQKYIRCTRRLFWNGCTGYGRKA